MTYTFYQIDFPQLFIIPLGDIHYGSKNFSTNSQIILNEKLNFVKKKKEARVILVGDLVDTATITSKTSVFDEDKTLIEQKREIAETLRPIKNKIIGAFQGNHERRTWKLAGDDPTADISDRLGIKYLGISGVIEIKIRKQRYLIYAHHTTGGGSTPGSKVNRAEKNRNLVTDCDIFLAAHSHGLGCVPIAVYIPEPSLKKCILKIQYLINTGGYLEWNDSYAEAAQFSPNPIGTPTIYLNGEKKEIGCWISTDSIFPMAKWNY